jgi:uncharacterized protein (TIGR04255 family)
MEENKREGQVLTNPEYPNPSIAEAVCEIHFNTEIPNFDKSIEELKRLFTSTYPTQQNKNIKQYQATMKEVGVSVEEKSVPVWTFKHSQRNHLIQISPHTVCVNELEKYPGWKTFSEDLSFTWDAIKKIFPIASIKHIGLRYINLIPRKNADETLSQWLQPNRYYPDGILDSVTGFVSRSEFNIATTKRLVVTIAEAIKKTNEKGFIFDIAAIMQIDESPTWPSMLERLDSLHTLISEVFFTSITRKYESYLKGEN